MSRLWTFRPNWGDGYTETLGWLTSVTTSQNGTEDRHRLRRAARVTLTFSVLVTDHERRAFDALVYAGQADTIWLPAFHDVARLESAASSGEVELDFSTSNRSFGHYSDHLILSRGDRWTRLEVDSFADPVTLTDALAEDWPAGTRVYPSWPTRIQQSLTVSRVTAGVSTVQVTAEAITTVELNTSFNFQVHYDGTLGGAFDPGEPFFGDIPNRADALDATYERISHRVDSEVGTWTLTDVSGRPYIIRSQDHLLWSRSDIQDFRTRIAFFAGRHGDLWVPTHDADLELVEPADSGATTIDVRRLGIDAAYDGDSSRADIAIRHDGSWMPRRIEAIAAIGSDVERLTLTEPISSDLTPDNVAQICWLEYVRLASDDLELEWRTPHVASTTLATRTL